LSTQDKVVVTCALTGVLTDPAKFNVPVTPQETAEATAQAYDAGASAVHCHFRDQGEGMGAWPTWDLNTVGAILSAIKQRVPDIIICMSTGVMGNDLSGPLGCLEAFKPELAACNAGSLNYLKIRKDGSWAWPPILFDNPVEKVNQFLEVMTANKIVPEFECFDTGIVRSVSMYQANGMFRGDPHLSFVMGVDSGMPANPDLLSILKEQLPENAHWQVIATGPGREKIWNLHNDRAQNNGQLVEALVKIVHETGKEVATTAEARQILGVLR
jgi:uncharacterized protein (DUF849 family)